jgi:excinuclease ABC subunit A
MLKDPIVVRGARQHNLKNVSVDLPTQSLVVITGPSGSGKSSLAFDTIFAEAQRRYMESLSAYARQFMEQLSKPDVDLVDGLSPAISIEQKTIHAHPRSTVGTITGIYDFVRLLYARSGVIRDPSSGQELKANAPEDVRGFVEKILLAGNRVQLLASVVRGKKGEFLREFEQWRRAGFSKVRIDGKWHDLHDPILIHRHQLHDIDVLLDQLSPNKTKAGERVVECLNICEKISDGWLRIIDLNSLEETLMSKRVASLASGASFPDLEPRLFSFNSPYGMCLSCKGLGWVEAEKSGGGGDEEDEFALFQDLSRLELCSTCSGRRLRKESLFVYFNGVNIADLTERSAAELFDFFESLPSALKVNPVVSRLCTEIQSRLQFLLNVGVGYLTLGRRADTLSGGEAQRIRLATQIGAQLSGVLYVLDEPSIGLHPKDQDRLLGSLKHLRDLGNTVLVVEHDEETMLQADYLVDVGPGAGIKGGHILQRGSPSELIAKGEGSTLSYLRGEQNISLPGVRRAGNGLSLELRNCSGHNLKNVSLKIPLGTLCVFTGVSGSGKSSLVRNTLEAALLNKLYRSNVKVLAHEALIGTEHIDKLVHVDQRPIGRTPRSNPATYTGVFSLLRSVYSQLPEAQIRGYTAGSFSFNKKEGGGRCDACEGAGRIRMEMHFLPDVFIPCESCQGARYRRDILEVRFRGKSIADVLAMDIESAYELLKNQPLLEPKLKTLLDVGLGYVQLGQSATTLSGGEAQRVKLAKELSKRSTGKTLYVLDEPTTGLHFEDIKKLLGLLQRLCDLGNTVLVIEHHLDIMAAADWLVDMGPGPGKDGGQVVLEGTPERFVASANSKDGGPSFTAQFLKQHFERKGWLNKKQSS